MAVDFIQNVWYDLEQRERMGLLPKSSVNTEKYLGNQRMTATKEG